MQDTTTQPYDSQTFHHQLREAKRILVEATAALLQQSQQQQQPQQQSAPRNEPQETFADSTDLSFTLIPTSSDITNNHNNNENDDFRNRLEKMTPEQEFQLAMRLFSDDDPVLMEQELQNQLVKVQESLSQIIISSSSSSLSGPEDVMGDTTMTMTMTDVSVQHAKDLQDKIQFLSWCNEAKIAIDSSSPSYYNHYSTVADKREDKEERGNNNPRPRRSWLIHCAERLVVARDALHKANGVWNDNHDNNDDDEFVVANRSENDIKVAKDVLKSIESQWSMRTWTVCYDAIQVVEKSVEIKENGIQVCLGMMTSDGKTIAGEEEQEEEEDIKTAMTALAMLSFGDESKYDKLEEMVLELAERILSIVIRPVIEAVREGLEDSKESTRVVYDVMESSTTVGQSSFRSGLDTGSSVINHGNNYNKKKNKKATVKVLEWTVRKVSNGTRPDETMGSDGDKCDGKDDSLNWWSSLIQLIQRVIQFVCDHMFDQVEDEAIRGEISSIFGRAILGKNQKSKNLQSLSLDFDITEYGTKWPMVKMLGKLAWDHCVPSEVNKDALDELESCSRVFKDSLSSLDSFLMDRNLSDQHIAILQYVDNLNQIYCDKVRMHVLAKGRKILLEGDYHNSIKVGVNLHETKKRETPEYLNQLGIEKQDMSIFLLEECGISQIASELMDLCIQTMDLAVEELTASHRLLPPTLYRATRELFDLYHAIIPTVHSSEIETIPRIAAVFHNDCCFFAHKLLTFGLEYRDRFPSDAQGKESGMRHICTYLDLVPIFREIAQRTMNDIIGYQKVQIAEIVNPRLQYFKDALGSNEGVVEWTDAETALTAGLYHLRHLSRTWKPVLPRQVYLISMGSIVDNFLSLFLDKVLAAKDISVQACQFVNALFQNGLRGVVEVFGSPTDPLEGAKDAEKSCLLYDKFAAVEKFMNMGIADINMALPEGIFRSMTGAELSRLVLAVFEDTDARRKLLRVLESN